MNYGALKRGWKRIEAIGDEAEWLKGVRSEKQWSDLMKRVNNWQERYEQQHGILFVREQVIVEEY